MWRWDHAIHLADSLAGEMFTPRCNFQPGGMILAMAPWGKVYVEFRRQTC